MHHSQLTDYVERNCFLRTIHSWSLWLRVLLKYSRTFKFTYLLHEIEVK